MNIFGLLFDAMKIDLSGKIASDGAKGTLPRWIRVWRIVGAVIGAALSIGIAVWLFKIGAVMIKTAALLGIGLVALGVIAIGAAVLEVLHGVGVFDKLRDSIYSYRYRK